MSEQKTNDERAVFKTELASHEFTVNKLKAFRSAVKIPFRTNHRKLELVDLVMAYLTNNNLLENWRKTFESVLENSQTAPTLETISPKETEATRQKLSEAYASFKNVLDDEQQKFFETIVRNVEDVAAKQ